MRVSYLLLVGCCLIWQSTHAQLVYKLVKIDCLGNPTRITNISCHIKPINWNLGVADLDSSLIMPVHNLTLQVQIFKKDYTNQYKPFLVDVSFNMCQIIKKRSYIPYGIIIWKHMKQYTNLNHSCPFSGHLRVRNGQLDTSLVPPFPQGFYLFNVTFMDYEYVGTIKFYFQIMEPIKSKKRPRT